MRKLIMSGCCLATLAAASVFGATAGVAREYPWCAQYGSNNGGANCGFVSYQQCRAALSGNGGSCSENQFFRGYRDHYVVREFRPAYYLYRY